MTALPLSSDAILTDSLHYAARRRRASDNPTLVGFFCRCAGRRRSQSRDASGAPCGPPSIFKLTDAGTPPLNPSTLAQVERPVTLAQAYCRLQRSNTGLNLSGGIKMLTLNYELDENGDSGFTAFIQSKDCPEGLFSVVSLDSQGRTRRLLNCQTAASQEILLQAGIQGNIEYTATPPGRIPLAISGAGYFLVQCPTGIFLQRSGDFQLRGEEVWLGACSVLNRDGQTLT